jgi:predicted anti-sigma-YlaC factor YlaD
MNHQPFESWIYTPEELSPQQAQALQEHLQACDQCYGQAAAWQQVQPLIASARMVSPAEGFVGRWQKRLQYERERREKRQSVLVFAAGLSLAFLFLILLAGMVVLTYNSPVDWLLVLVSRLAALVLLLEAFMSSFIILREMLPPGWWIGAGLAASVLCLLWIFSLQKLATRRIVT